MLAEAISEHGDIIITEKLIEMLPLYAEKIAAPLMNIDSVKIIDTGGNGGNGGIAAYGKSITDTMVGLHEPLKELTGIDITKVLKDLTNRGNTHTVVVPGNMNEISRLETSVISTEESETSIEVH